MNIDIIRAWKDRSYRESLTEEEQALLPKNPVGQVELTDDQLKEISGALDQRGGSWNWCGGGSWNCGSWNCGSWRCGSWRCGSWRCGSWRCGSWGRCW